MILKWNKKCLKVIPVKGKKSNNIKSKIVLMFGYNDIIDEYWPLIEPIVQDRLDDGMLEVIAQEKEVTRKGPGGKERNVVEKKPIPFSELSSVKADKLIEETFNLKTLEKWLKKETRDEVRLSLKERIDYIKKETSQTAKKDKK